MPSKNKKQLNFFLLVKAYKEYGEMGVLRQYKYLEGSKPKLTDEYMNKIIKTSESIKPADLIDMTSGTESDNPLGDKKELKAGYWALFRGKYKPRDSKDEAPKEGEFIAMIKRVDNQKGFVSFHQHNFRNKFGQTIEIPKRAEITHPEHLYLDFSSFDNVIRTGKNPQEVARERENLMEVRKIIRKLIKENFNISDGDLIPEDLIDIFYNRIKEKFNMGATKDHPSIERELKRIKSINGDVIPLKIQKLLQ